jgi:methanogenic corrinoid protein MtbC1
MTDDRRQQDFLAALLAGDRPGSAAIVMAELARRQPIPDLYETIFKTALYRIGDLWKSGRISVATEHLASAVVEGILNELYPRVISCDRANKTVIAACVETELHRIGIRMVADVFEMNGWNALFLGSDTPCADLIDLIEKTKPDALALSLSGHCRLPALEKTIPAVRQACPALRIFVGGWFFRSGGQEFLSKHPDVRYAADLHALDSFIKEF